MTRSHQKETVMGKVRIIAGQFGGRQITTPKTDRTHPMSERVKGALFNKIVSDITGANVLDAFSGSGALGLEALSRGAAQVTFVEKDRVASKIIAENIELLGVENTTKNIHSSVGAWCETQDKHNQFDIIFADPPYHNEQFSTVKTLFELLKPGGLMVLSHTGRGEVPTLHRIVVVDSRSYGTAHLTFFRREDA